MTVWDAVAAGIPNPASTGGPCVPTVCQVRAAYALQVATRIVLDDVIQHVREHIATYAVWHLGHINPDALADSLCDHLRDVTPLPVDAVEELL